jgi:hypothetical protein
LTFDPYFKPPEPRKKRRVTEEAFRPEERIPDVEAPGVEETFNRLANLANKAKVLADAAGEASKFLFIPVDPDAEQVRAAVKRKDQTSTDGGLITFDLFKDAIDFVEHRRQSLDLGGITSLELTGNAQTDSEKINKHLRKTDDPDLSEEQLLLLGSQLMILFILNQMMGPYKAIDTQQVVATKIIPPAVEVAPTIGQILIGVAIQLLIIGVQEAAVMEFFKSSGAAASVGITPEQIVEQAKAQPLTDVQELAKKRFGEGDYEQILEYSFNHIQSTLEPGFETWIGYSEARSVRSTAINHWKKAPQFSFKHAAQANFGSSEVDVEVIDLSREIGQGESALDQIPPGVEEGIPDSLREAINQSISRAPVDYVCMLDDFVDAEERRLNQIAQVLSTDFTKDAVCCLVHLLGTVDPAMLRAIRAGVQTMLGFQGKTLQLSFGNLLNNLLGILNRRVREELTALSAKAVDKVLGPIFDFLNSFDDDEIPLFRQCPLFADLLNMLLSIAHDFRLSLIALIEGISIDFELEVTDAQNRWMVLHNGRKIRLVMKILDAILDALQRGNLCGEKDRDDEAIRDISEGFPTVPHIEIDPELRTRFFPDTEPVVIKPGEQPLGMFDDVIPSLDSSKIGLDPEDNTDTGRRCRELFDSAVRAREI